MLGTEYKWLLAPVRPGAKSRVQLARHSLLTLAVAGGCLLATFLNSGSTLPPVAAAATPVVAALDQTPPEWPRTVIRLWFLLPQLLPGQN
jgi:hypothetical protein